MRGKIRRDESGKAVSMLGIVTETSPIESWPKQRLRTQLERLSLLDQITRAIGERQDLQSIFQVVVRSLEDSLPIDFGCVCLYDPASEVLTVTCDRRPQRGARRWNWPCSRRRASTSTRTACRAACAASWFMSRIISQVPFPFPAAAGARRAAVAGGRAAAGRKPGVRRAHRRAPRHRTASAAANANSCGS